jgi:hypothetical protein
MRRIALAVVAIILSLIDASAQSKWIESNDGLEGGTVYAFASRQGDDADLYAGASDGVYRFDRNATRWNRIAPLFNVHAVAACVDGTVVAGNDSGLHQIRPSMSPVRTSPIAPVRAMVRSHTGTIVAVLNDSTRPRGYRSTDCGATWTQVPSAGDGLAVSDDGVFYSFGENNAVVALRSTDDGATWQGLAMQVLAVAPLTGDSVLASAHYSVGDTLYLSSDRGTTWSSVPAQYMARLAHGEDDEVFGTSFPFASGDRVGLYRNSSDRRSWTRVRDDNVATMHEAARGEWWISTGSTVFLSTDRGATWSERAVGLTALRVPVMAQIGDTIVAIAGGGTGWSGSYSPVPDNYSLFRSTNGGRSWNRHFAGVETWLRVSGSSIWATRIHSSMDAALLYSLDAGTTWDSLHVQTSIVRSGLISPSVGSDGSILVAIGSYDATSLVVRSTDRGVTWSITDGPQGLTALREVGDAYFGAALGGTSWMIVRSTDDGLTWQFPLAAVEWLGVAVTPNGDLYYLGARDHDWDHPELYRAAAGSDRLDLVRTFDHLALRQFEATPFGELLIYEGLTRLRSTDGGVTWDSVPLPRVGYPVHSGATTYLYGYSPVYTTAGIDRSTDNGISWTQIETPFPGIVPLSLLVNSDGELVAGTDGAGVFRLPAEPSGIATHDAMHSMSISPNPASNGATLTMMQSGDAHVTIELRDVLGTRRALLLDATLDAGEHRFTIPTTGLADGVYFITINGRRAEGLVVPGR